MAEKDRLRAIPIRLWVSKDEHDIAVKKADSCGLNMSEFVREMIVFGAIIRYAPFDMKSVCASISKIGTNINQIAHRINEFSAISNNDFISLKNAYEDLLELYIEKVMGG